MNVRSIYVLTHEEIVQAAREQADAGEPCSHGFEPGSTQAITYERHYVARQAELQEVEA